MREGYSSVGGGGPSYSGFDLTQEDLERILGEYFGFDPATVNIIGLEIPNGEIHVSGEIAEEALPEPSLR
jgi:hypothetical protein